jgi:hypothetical protein
MMNADNDAPNVLDAQGGLSYGDSFAGCTGRREVSEAIRVSTGQDAHGSAKCGANTRLSEAIDAAISVSAVCRAHCAIGPPRPRPHGVEGGTARRAWYQLV